MEVLGGHVRACASRNLGESASHINRLPPPTITVDADPAHAALPMPPAARRLQGQRQSWFSTRAALQENGPRTHETPAVRPRERRALAGFQQAPDRRGLLLTRESRRVVAARAQCRGSSRAGASLRPPRDGSVSPTGGSAVPGATAHTPLDPTGTTSNARCHTPRPSAADLLTATRTPAFVLTVARSSACIGGARVADTG
jgi:hypothetical protein